MATTSASASLSNQEISAVRRLEEPNVSDVYEQALKIALEAAMQRPEGSGEAPTDTAIAMVPSADITHGIEKFTAKDLATLRNDLLQSGLDSFQAAELVTTFLGGRGYGISTDEARCVAMRMEGVSFTVERLEEELARVARVA